MFNRKYIFKGPFSIAMLDYPSVGEKNPFILTIDPNFQRNIQSILQGLRWRSVFFQGKKKLLGCPWYWE